MPEVEYAEPEATVTESKLIPCLIEGCTTRHLPWLFVDGVEVATAYCQDHANDSFRALWALGAPGHDPRHPDQRFAPWGARTYEVGFVRDAVASREDIKPCPDEGRIELPWTDARSGMSKL